MSKNRLRGLVWSLGILVIAAAIAAVYLAFRSPSTEKLFPLNESSSTTLVLSPDDKTTFPADASIPVLISAISEKPLSLIELWADGRLVSSIQPAEREGQQYSHLFYWTPTREGNQRILGRSIDAEGQISTSNPIQIQISSAAGARMISRDENGNPVSEMPISLTGDLDLHLPISDPPQFPVHNLPEVEHMDSLPSVWLRKQFSVNTVLPRAPELVYSVNDCVATLVLFDNSENELGFFIYRSGPGNSSFQRIGELKSRPEGGSFSYHDPDIVPGAIYYAAAYNSSGESPSSPLMITDFGPSCLPPGSPDGLDQEDLEILDLAYFYYSFNGGGFQRYPSNPEGFLTPSEYPTSIRALVEGLAGTSSALIKDANVVLWGWSGGDLVNLGSYHLLIDDSRLLVCNLGTGCTGDVASGFRSTFGELANDAEKQIREFYWATTAQGTTSVLWQISTSPFSEEFSPHPYGLVAAGCSDGSAGGSFLVDFKDLDAYLPAPSSCGDIFQPWIEFSRFGWETGMLPGFETHYFIRFTPMAGNLPAGKPSNSVEILAKPGESVIEPIIVDHLPEIYQVEITDFTPIKKMDPTYWGCVFITSLDYNLIWEYYRSTYPPNITDGSISQMADKIYNDLNYAIQNNLIVCPAPYQKSSDSGSVLGEWGSMFVESLKEIWDGVVSAFNALKAEVVDQVANAINKLGIPCDSECKAGLRAGLEIGITYFTGIPPNLPSFEQLKDQGIEYAIQMAAAEAGIPCPAECQQILREGLEEVVDSAAQINKQPGCVDESWANLLGKHSLCLPPGVETAAVPEGVSEPARSVIKITRTGQGLPGQYQYDGQPAYVVTVRFSGVNTGLSGTSIPYNYSYLDWDKGYQQFFTVTAPVFTLQNDVFDSQSLPIPPLAPGESISIPLTLVPHTYYIPEHLHSLMIELNTRDLEINEVGGIGGSRGALFDWLCLHNGAMIKIEASVSCLSTPSGLVGSTLPDDDAELVPCGSIAEPYFYQETSDVCYP